MVASEEHICDGAVPRSAGSGHGAARGGPDGAAHACLARHLHRAKTSFEFDYVVSGMVVVCQTTFDYFGLNV